MLVEFWLKIGLRQIFTESNGIRLLLSPKFGLKSRLWSNRHQVELKFGHILVYLCISCGSEYA